MQHSNLYIYGVFHNLTNDPLKFFTSLYGAFIFVRDGFTLLKYRDICIAKIHLGELESAKNNTQSLVDVWDFVLIGGDRPKLIHWNNHTWIKPERKGKENLNPVKIYVVEAQYFEDLPFIFVGAAKSKLQAKKMQKKLIKYHEQAKTKIIKF